MIGTSKMRSSSFADMLPAWLRQFFFGFNEKSSRTSKKVMEYCVCDTIALTVRQDTQNKIVRTEKFVLLFAVCVCTLNKRIQKYNLILWYYMWRRQKELHKCVQWSILKWIKSDNNFFFFSFLFLTSLFIYVLCSFE